MTKRDFFILLIKLFGLISIVTTLTSVIPGNMVFVSISPDPFTVSWVIVVILVVIGLFSFLVFKAEVLVDLLKLDRGFDDDRIDLGNLGASDVVKLGAFIVGGLLILNNIPAFLSHTLFSFKGSVI